MVINVSEPLFKRNVKRFGNDIIYSDKKWFNDECFGQKRIFYIEQNDYKYEYNI